jgi:hypothetical protein
MRNDRSMQRFNEYADLRTSDGRVFAVVDPCIRSFFAWEQVYIVELELFEKQDQYTLPYHVTIHWEELHPETLPNHPALYRLARTAIGEHLEGYRAIPNFSSHRKVIKLKVG